MRPANKTVSLIQHAPSCPPGEVLQILKRHGLPFQIHHVYRGDALPRLEGTALLIALGGEGPVSEMKKEELALIEACVRQNTQFLGLCLGAEALAHVLGARIHRHGCMEKGWVELRVPDSNSRPWTMFTNHEDSFDLPHGSTLTMLGAKNLNQGFTYGRAQGLQFHPNSQEDTIRKIADGDPEILSGLIHLDRQHAWLDDFFRASYQKLSFE